MKSTKTMLKGLDPDDLREWAGSKICNRGKSYIDQVSDLSRTEDGYLAAWVSGSYAYATAVRYNGKDGFDYMCTCPFEGFCKHVVAVLLAALEQIKQKNEVPLLDPDDDLYLEAFEGDEEADEWEDDDDDPDPDNSLGKRDSSRARQLESLLAGKSQEALRTMLVELALDFPEVARRIRDTGRLETGQIDKIISSLRREIRSLTTQDAWYNHWKGTGNLPDYEPVEKQLRLLLKGGHADAVLEIGEDLWKRGNKQVSRSDDDGTTAMAIAACMEIVLQALPGTRLSPSEQLLWLVDHELADEYSLLEGMQAAFNHSRYSAAHWQDVATGLEERLRIMKNPQADHYTGTYRRERVMTWLRDAYERSGQLKKVIPLLEQEADRCRSYKPLVTALLEAGERDRARQWCIRGFNKTIKNAPGIASGLQALLRQVAEAEKKYDLVAAYRAEDFFDQPSLDTYGELQKATKKLKLWPQVREKVLDYLKTGKNPSRGETAQTSWPLPKPEVRHPESRRGRWKEAFPDREMLIEIALHENRHDDAVSLHQELVKTRRWGRGWGIDRQLAKAVAKSHPDVSLKIWKAIADDLIDQVKPKAYEEAVIYLRQMHRVYRQSGRLADWKALLENLRVQHKAKRRLQAELDRLEKDIKK